ncbi:MAG: transcriptional regulator NrdR, partial [Micrococcales bacterium]|nr:transcriptional regulator NrdR [Micrococcales bacterium]
MFCPFCRHPDSRGLASRTSVDGTSVRRRRRCP